MKVSVIIPVFNGAAWLHESIGSVLGQSRIVDEIIAVDDGSTDDSPAILASYGDRLTVVHQENRGVAVARNTALTRATGEVITFLDQDDLWPVERTAVMVNELRADPQIAVVAGVVEILYERTTPPEYDIGPAHREFLLGSLAVRAEVFQKLGPFNTNVGYSDDTDFWLRRIEAGTRTRYLDKVSLIYRMHDGNTSANRAVGNQNLLAALRESLKRRRARNAGSLPGARA